VLATGFSSDLVSALMQPEGNRVAALQTIALPNRALF
jgi:hypothetical protein